MDLRLRVFLGEWALTLGSKSRTAPGAFGVFSCQWKVQCSAPETDRETARFSEALVARLVQESKGERCGSQVIMDILGVQAMCGIASRLLA